MTKFSSCLEELSKTAGLLDRVKDLALTEVAGTKPWVIGRKAPLSDSLKNTGKLIAGARGPSVHGISGAAQSGVRKAVRGASTGAAAGGQRVYDVSAEARKMGLI
jgi:hypothetical protein